jgi:hydrogenase expression/formation protein HypE
LADCWSPGSEKVVARVNLLGPGKIPIDVLEKTVLRLRGKESKSIVTPPKAGLDFAAVKVGSKYMLVSADPITGVTKDIGEYAINVSANDVATSGNRPQFAETVVLLPEGSGRRSVGVVAAQLDAAAKRLGIAIVGGHTEVTPALERPIVMVTAFCFVDDYVTSGDAREGDSIMMTKTAGLEGTAVLAGRRSLARAVGRETVRKASGFLSRISVVDEAVAAYGTRFVRAMHDCTEGGVAGAVYEMSLASGVGFALEEKAVPVAPETRSICNHLSLDPLKLIASGSILLSVKKGKEEEVRSALKGTRVTRVGEFVRRKRVLIRSNGDEIPLDSAPEDELWRALRRTG